MRVTLKDIADKLNLSVNTVSRGLRDMPDVAEETKELIRQTAKHLGYRKNLAASRLRTNRSYIIGVVVTDYSNPAMSKIINGVESVGKRAGYTIMTGASNENAIDEENCVNRMLEQGVDGLIIIPTLLNVSLLEKIDDTNVPYVLAVRKYDGYSCNTIYCDDVYGADLVAEKLYQCGHRSFLYVSGLKHISSDKERLIGFTNRLKSHGIPNSSMHVLQSNGSRIDAYNVTNNWLMKHSKKMELPVSAIFAFSDYAACGVYMALKEHGYRIPQDVSIVGYDNNEFSTILDPALSTVDNHFYEIGQSAAKRVLVMLEQPKEIWQQNPEQITTTPNLVWRNSVSTPNKALST
ncbi:MAG: LacI family transcriptional regulator [Clostridiaceae bacterium]|nr:LacI family transcriptional regulator [Clostridiaceae bacterium]